DQVLLPAELSLTGTLNNGKAVSLELDRDRHRWTLVGPETGIYDPMVAGTYTYKVPVILPDDPASAFSNSQNLTGIVEITIEKKAITFALDNLAQVYDG